MSRPREGGTSSPTFPEWITVVLITLALLAVVALIARRLW